MSNVISFLEKMGQDAALHHATHNEMKLALARTEINPELQAAIMIGDQRQLAALVGARTNLVCGQSTPIPDDDDKKLPFPDDDEITTQPAMRRVA